MSRARRLRYALVGTPDRLALGIKAYVHLHASEVTALVVRETASPEKLEGLRKRLHVRDVYPEEWYEDCLNSANIDAVHLLLPLSLRESFTIRAARAGIHVLVETPLAPTEYASQRMIDECHRNRALLQALSPEPIETLGPELIGRQIERLSRSALQKRSPGDQLRKSA